jgi:general stress protein 26
MNKPSPNMETRSRLAELIKDIRFAMFTSRHGDGRLHSCPMTTQIALDDDERSLWFFVSRRGETAADVARDAAVNVSYADPAQDRYVSVSGNAMLIEDKARKNEHWSTLVEAWFPGGIDDPDLALIRVDIVQAEFWDVGTSKAVQVLKLAKAAVTGNRPVDMGEHREVRMR